MKKRFTEEQIVKMIQEHKEGKTVPEISREYGIAAAGHFSGIDNLMKGQYELKKSIQNDMDLNSWKGAKEVESPLDGILDGNLIRQWQFSKVVVE